MNQTENMLTAEDRQILTAWRLIGKGIAILLGNTKIMDGALAVPQSTPASGSKAASPKAEPETPKAVVSQDKPKAADAATADTPAAKTEAPDGKAVKRSDVERAMAAKIKALAAQGNGPGAIGQLFPKFHGAQCVSDLTEADYPAFLEELSKL